MGRSRGRQRSSSSTPLYSKQDIREQYCISERGLGALEAQRGGSAGGLFGCLAGAHPTSPCAAAARGSLLTVCVRRRVPSDENIHELCRRPQADYAPMPRYPRYYFAFIYIILIKFIQRNMTIFTCINFAFRISHETGNEVQNYFLTSNFLHSRDYLIGFQCPV